MSGGAHACATSLGADAGSGALFQAGNSCLSVLRPSSHTSWIRHAPYPALSTLGPLAAGEAHGLGRRRLGHHLQQAPGPFKEAGGVGGQVGHGIGAAGEPSPSGSVLPGSRSLL